jgi:electron transfer flavoprotein alpha subunit
MSQDIFVVIEHLRGQVQDSSYVMLAAARHLSKSTGGGVTAVLLGHGAQGLAATLAADKVIYIDHAALAEFTSDAYLAALAGLIGEQSPRAVLFGHSSVGMDVAAGLSARLGLPAVSSCSRFTDGGRFVSQICGGKIMAEGELPAPTALVTVVSGGYKAEQGQSNQAPPVTTAPAPTLDGLRVTLKKRLDPRIEILEVDSDINSREFAAAVIAALSRAPEYPQN